jgi:D-glycero-D-manno-heptose 1,7-bisphosphate phosphatase
MKILFCDLDGTIRQTISGEKFINKPDDQQLIKGAKEAIEQYYNDGWLIVGITNQAGVHYGHKSLEDCILEQQITMELLPEIYQIYACADLGETMLRIGTDHWSKFDGEFKDTRIDNKIIPPPEQFNFDSFRKPGIGMIQYFRITHNAFEQELLIGDMDSDRQCAEKAGIDFIWAEEWLKQYWIV